MDHHVKKRLQEITNRINDLDDDDTAESILIVIEDELSMLHGMDAFGTEGQGDPRGDFRNGDWSVWDMEDFDE